MTSAHGSVMEGRGKARVVFFEVMSANVQAIEPEWRRPLRVSDYHQLIEAGAFDEDERVELLEGTLVTMSPQGYRHAPAIEYLTWAIQRALDDAYRVRVQLPLTLSEHSEPEPDIAVVAAGATAAASRHGQHPDRPLLVVEVADSSLHKDRGVKAPIYARAGVPEYWIVNVDTREIEVYRDPDRTAGRFRTASTASAGDSVSPPHLPGLTVHVDALFGS